MIHIINVEIINKLKIGDTKMKKEKDMMNPCNWRTEDVKDAVQAAVLAASGIILAYATIWLAY